MSSLKKVIAIGILLSAYTCICAQDSYVRPAEQATSPSTGTVTSRNHKFSFGISIGPSIPSGQFASTNVKNSFWDFHSPDSIHLQGFAKTGFYINLNFSYQITDYLGIMFIFGSSSNGFDINTFSTSVGLPSYTQTNSYSIQEFLIGPYFSYSEGPQWKFKARALIGYFSINYPEINVAVTDSITNTIDFNGGGGFAYNFGGSIEYNLWPRTALSLSADYTASNVTYDGYVLTSSKIGYYPYVYNSPSYSISMPTGLLKVCLGVVLNF